jgi:hypothetical protein
MNWLNRIIEQSAYEWDMSSSAAWWLFWLPIVGTVMMIFAGVERDIYRFLLSEDGPVEWLTFVGFIVAALIGTRIFFLCLKTNHIWLAGIYAIFAVAMLFCAGEEISWGQRILDFEIPESLRNLNPTNDLVFHNLGGTFGVFNLAIIVVEFIGVMAFLINRKLRLEKRLTHANYLLIPPFFLASSFFIALVYNPIRLILWPEPTFTVSRFSEWTELCLVFGICAFTWLALRHLRGEMPRETPRQSLRLRNSSE